MKNYIIWEQVATFIFHASNLYVKHAGSDKMVGVHVARLANCKISDLFKL